MDYTIPSFRKTKGDKKAKRRFRVYKKGGKHREGVLVKFNREG